MMALAHLRERRPTRDLHLFDSFVGLPEPDARRDGAAAIRYAEGRGSGENRAIGKCVGTLAENQQLLQDRVGYPKERLFFHPGWFEDPLPALPADFGPIALLRLDSDWYASTKLCLETLFDRVSPGGIIVIDDYGYWEGCREAVDEFFRARKIRPYLHYIDLPGRYFFK